MWEDQRENQCFIYHIALGTQPQCYMANTARGNLNITRVKDKAAREEKENGHHRNKISLPVKWFCTRNSLTQNGAPGGP